MQEPFKTYEIGGRKFALHELKLGQEQQLARLFTPIFNAGDSVEVAMQWSDLRHKVLAVALTEEGTQLRDKHVDELAELLQEELTGQQAEDMLQDFFGCIPITSVMTRMAAGVAGIHTAPPKTPEQRP